MSNVFSLVTTDVSRNPVNVTNGYFEILVPSREDDTLSLIFDHLILSLKNLSNVRSFVVFRDESKSNLDRCCYICCYVLDDCKQRRRLSPFTNMLLFPSLDFHLCSLSFCSKSRLTEYMLNLLSSPSYTFIKKSQLLAYP